MRISEIIAKMWHSLDKTEKDKYCKEFHNEMVKHRHIMAQYNSSLTADDNKRIKEKKDETIKEIENKKIAKSLRIKSRELQKPRLVAPFFKYLHGSLDRQPDEKYPDFVLRKSAEWRALSEKEKEKFRPTAEDLKNYR